MLWGATQDLFFTLLSVFLAACVIQQAVSYRRASGERRQQLKWLASGILICGVCGLASNALSSRSGIWLVVGGVAVVGITALPASMAVAILRYRVYEIGRIISRTLAYTVVTGLLVGLYAGLVLLATHVLSFSSPVAVAASTLAAAALFSPAWPGSSTRPWNPPTYRYGSASTTEARAVSAQSPSQSCLPARPGAPQLWCFLDERLLRCAIGASKVMQSQLYRLANLAEHQHTGNVIFAAAGKNKPGPRGAGRICD